MASVFWCLMNGLGLGWAGLGWVVPFHEKVHFASVGLGWGGCGCGARGGAGAWG